jgi:hypothetical protein
MSPSYIYELNDVFYKLVLANIYFETKLFVYPFTIFEQSAETLNSNDFMYLSYIKADLVDKTNFPKQFKYLIQQLNDFLRFILQSTYHFEIFPPSVFGEIDMEEEFKKIGVVINLVQLEATISTMKYRNPLSNFNKESNRFNRFLNKVSGIVNLTKKVNDKFINRFVDQYK